MLSLKNLLFCKKEKVSSYSYHTGGNTDQIWYHNSLQEKEKPINLPIFLSELRKNHFYCFFVLVLYNQLDLWKHVLQGKITQSIV